MKQNKNHLTDYEQDRDEFLKDPKHKAMYDEYGRQFEVAYGMLQLRKKKKLSQLTVAKHLGTTQSNVARMEAGNQNFTLAMLGKIARVFGKELIVQFK